MDDIKLKSMARYVVFAKLLMEELPYICMEMVYSIVISRWISWTKREGVHGHLGGRNISFD